MISGGISSAAFLRNFPASALWSLTREKEMLFLEAGPVEQNDPLSLTAVDHDVALEQVHLLHPVERRCPPGDVVTFPLQVGRQHACPVELFPESVGCRYRLADLQEPDLHPSPGGGLQRFFHHEGDLPGHESYAGDEQDAVVSAAIPSRGTETQTSSG